MGTRCFGNAPPRVPAALILGSFRHGTQVAESGGKGDSMIKDVAFALRLLAKNKAFTLAATLTLAIGIGGTTVMFTILDAVLIRPLPFAEPDRLVWGFGRFPQGDSASISPPDFMDYRAQAKSLRVAAMTSFGLPTEVTGSGEPEVMNVRPVSAGLFETLGATPVLGRTFVGADEQEERPLVAAISHGLWQRRFGSDPAVVGRTLVLDGHPATIVGVMQAGFDFPGGVEVWTPLPLRSGEMHVRRFHFLRLLGRLSHGATPASAQAELDAIAAVLAREHPASNQGWSVRLVSLRDALVGPARAPVLVSFGAVLCVLLIACVNVTNLLLARGAARSGEMAIRAALGAGRTRILRQLLAEGVVLALVGGLAGVAIAHAGVQAVRSFAPDGAARLASASVDGRVLAFALAVSLVTGLLFGLAPARAAARLDVRDAVGNRVAGGPPRRVRAALVVAEVGIAATVLVGAGLLARSLFELLRVDPGFDPKPVLSAVLQLPEARYPDDDRLRTFATGIVEEMQSVPGVARAAVTSRLPMAPQGGDTYFTIEGEPAPADKPTADIRGVSPGYFETMRIAVASGRDFAASDAHGAPPVAVVNEPFVRRFFPAGNALGRRLAIDMGETFVAEVVGVVEGVRQYSLSFEPNPAMYVPFAQYPARTVNLVVQASGAPAGAMAGVRSAIQRLDRSLPVDVVAQSERVARSAAQSRFRTTLIGIFAVVALVLSAIGIYGVLAGLVAERRREIGVRVALGAGASEVVALVVRESLRLAVAGLAIGAIASLALGRLVSGLLFGVHPWDPVTFVGVAVVMAAAAATASVVPARQVTRVDPAAVLRQE
jgi:putative ABC transport system permease protein